MAKKIQAYIKLQVKAGEANPSPPVGPALGQHGVNIMAFCKEYNARTSAQVGSIIPVEITVFADQSFTFVTKTPPVPDLLRKAVGVDKGASDTGREVVGSITPQQLREIAEIKMKDLNAIDIEGAERQIMGTARSMGIKLAD